MANRRNSIKKIKADEKKQTVNRQRISEIRTITRKFKGFCQAKDAENASAAQKVLFAKLDKAIKTGTLKENTVNRTKSRLHKTLNLLKA